MDVEGLDLTADADPSQGSSRFPIVAIGASAGGLQAIKAFFQHMPPDSGAAFVVVQHLAPEFKSMMAEIIQSDTAMRVHQVADGMPIEPNHIYTMVPGAELMIEHGTLRLVDPDRPRGRRLPIDRFFTSLAEDQEEHAICVLMSGTGSDGALSLKTVKALSGITIAQDGGAAYPDMPQSAISTGMVDYVLTAELMPTKILEVIQQRPHLPKPSEAPAAEHKNEELQAVLRRVKLKTGHDFSMYKQSTVLRRIERRMVLLQLDSLRSYGEHIKNSDTEARILFQELLIGVTTFFRDPEAFEVIASTVLPELLSPKGDHDPLRVWAIGCSTGEEAYSLAMVVTEYMQASGKTNPVQVFATDIDDESLDVARKGHYPDAIEAHVTPERLERFFEKVPGGYQILKPIREMVVFAPHSLVKDSPYSRVDLISCRNLLIYLSAQLQSRIMPLLHYSLSPDGVLFLGPSESAGDNSELFTPIDRKWRIYRRKQTQGRRLFELPLVPVDRPQAPHLETGRDSRDPPLDRLSACCSSAS